MIERPYPLIDFRHVFVSRGTRLVLHDISLKIQVGEHVAILGPNGCGKTTLIKTIMRECYPIVKDGSSLTILGHEQWNILELRSILGIVSNDLIIDYIGEFSGREVVISGFFGSIGIWPHHEVTQAMRIKADEVLACLGISHLADRHICEMSSGEIRRILIGRALVHDPKTLLMDEPSTSLDIYAQRELQKTLRKLANSGTAVLIVTHHLSDIFPEIDRVILMQNGRVFADGVKSQVLTADCLSHLFGIPIEVIQHNGYYHVLW